MDIFVAQICGARRPAPKEKRAHVNVASLEKTNQNKNIENLVPTT